MKITICITAFVILIAACNKEQAYQPSLPDATSSGQNTLGFLYNGSTIWTGIEVAPTATADQFNLKSGVSCILQSNTDSTKTIIMQGKMYLKDKSGTITANSDLLIQISNINPTKTTYTFDHSANPRIVEFKNKLPAAKTYANNGNTFSLTITYFDESKQIISGTFSGTLYAYTTRFDLSDSLPIQSGRFDVNYSQ